MKEKIEVAKDEAIQKEEVRVYQPLAPIPLEIAAVQAGQSIFKIPKYIQEA